MRYPPAHKQHTRQRILKAASRQFRQRGFDGAGVASVMKEAKLTHGGFYAHFRTKRELIEEVIREGYRGPVEGFADQIAHLPPRERLEAWVRRYLTPLHRDHPAGGCPFAASASDAARAHPEARAAFGSLFTERLAVIACWIEDVPPAEAEVRVLAATSQMIGALMLARTLEEPMATRMLDAAADAAIRALLAADA